jgi:MFS family permease
VGQVVPPDRMTMTAPVALPHRHRPGSIRAAFAYRDFRLVWMGLFASNIGTWMQNVALPAYIQRRTGSGALVGLMVFAQLGPMLLLAIPAGVLASRVRSRPLLLGTQCAQIVGALVLAALIARDAPYEALFAANLFVGTSGALGAPAFQSTTPRLVDRRDLSGAVALNSVQLNASRVVGPVVAAVLGLWGVSTSQIFVINAGTYLFVIAAIAAVHLPTHQSNAAGSGWRSLTAGHRIARGRPVLSRLLVAMTLWSFFGLVHVGLFPTIAEHAFGIVALSTTYQWLYAVWGFGACLGAISTGTVFAQIDKRRMVGPGFVGFAVSLAAFGMVSSPAPAFAVGFVLGFWYFLTATALATVFQQNVRDNERPLVMSLWFMSFGGTVPLGNLAFGPVIDHLGPRPVLLLGAAVTVGLAHWCRLTRMPASAFLEEFGGDPLEPGDPAALHKNGIAGQQ